MATDNCNSDTLCRQTDWTDLDAHAKRERQCDEDEDEREGSEEHGAQVARFGFG